MIISTRSVIEVAGFPKEHIEKVVVKIVEKLKQENNVIKSEVFEAIELKDKMQGFWSAFAEIEIDFENLDKITAFCFEYMPSSIEILKPEDINLKNIHFSNLLNDLLARLHEYDMVVKNLTASNMALKKNVEKN